MNLKETAEDSIMELINTYTTAPKGRKRKVNVLHNNFEDLPKDTRRLIEGVLAEVYLGDFEIIRKAFVDKLELFLRLVFNSLVEAKCIDDELLGKIEETREKIANVVNEVEVSDADIKWLKKIGFLPVDVFEFASKYDIVDVIFELRENIDEYKLILGDYKYIVKILKMHEGLYKLKRLISFYRNYDKDLIKFNGSHLSQIVVNSDWEEKLKYFEDPDKLKCLTDVGFNGYHLSQIVVGSDWEEKLKYFEDSDKLKRLTDVGFEPSHLSQIVVNSDWEEKLKYFEDPDKLKYFTDEGFNGYHLSQIVVGSDWEEKLKYFEDPDKLKRLTDVGFNGYHLSQIVRNADWEEKLKYFEDPDKLKYLTDAKFEPFHLSMIVRNADWEEKLRIITTEDCLVLLREGRFTYNSLTKLLLKKDWRKRLKALGVKL